jgi:hypothetical protein
MSCVNYNLVARVMFGILLHVQYPAIHRKGASLVCTTFTVPFLQTVVYRIHAKCNTKLTLIYYARMYIKFLEDDHNLSQVVKHFVNSVIMCIIARSVQVRTWGDVTSRSVVIYINQRLYLHVRYNFLFYCFLKALITYRYTQERCIAHLSCVNLTPCTP